MIAQIKCGSKLEFCEGMLQYGEIKETEKL